MRDSAEVVNLEKSLRTLLLRFYSQGHRYIQGVNLLISVHAKDSYEYALAISSLGWSGAGSFMDQVFCDVDSKTHSLGELREAEKELHTLMKSLGEHALEIDENAPNNQAIRSMLLIWR